MLRAAATAQIALLFIALAVPSNAQTTAGSESEATLASNVVMYDIRGNLSLRCPVPGSPVSWSKNGTALEQIPELVARSELTEEGHVFSIRGRAQEADWGNYTCSANGDSYLWDVRGRPLAHLPDNTNVVEGQRLRLVCTLKGLPYPAVQWTFTNGTLNMSDVSEALSGRAVLETSDQGVEGAALLVESALREDAGEFACRPAVAGGVASVTVVRVKDMYAALWPFLGICAEVFVLCAVILIYERRRTKPECDDSDTDHDQKKS